MEALPFEVIDAILTISARDSLSAVKALRQTSKLLSISAIPSLFSTIVLRDTAASAVAFAAFLDVSANRPLVRTIIVEFGTSFIDPPDTSARHTSRAHAVAEEPPRVHTLLPSTVAALARLPELPNLTGAEIRFVKTRVMYSFCNPTLRLREVPLWEVVKALAVVETITRLVVRNLAAAPTPTLGESAGFVRLMSRVTELELRFVVPESLDNMFPSNEADWFFAELPETWLRGREQLKRLTLGCGNSWWGAVPLFELQDLDFPVLESLHLHRFSIHHVWQVDFLCRQKTLRHLTLDGAHILYCYLRDNILDCNYDEPVTLFWRPWGWIFSRIGSELPALAEFEYILSPNNTLGCEEFGGDGWTGRYYTLYECEPGLGCWNEYIGDGGAVGCEPPGYPAFSRLEKMDLAELVRLKEKLGGRWRFDAENGVGRELLEDPEAEIVEVYGTGERSDEYVWFDTEEEDEDEEDEDQEDEDEEDEDEEDEDEEDEGENMSWDVRKNLELNGLLGRTVPPALVREGLGMD